MTIRKVRYLSSLRFTNLVYMSHDDCCYSATASGPGASPFGALQTALALHLLISPWPLKHDYELARWPRRSTFHFPSGERGHQRPLQPSCTRTSPRVRYLSRSRRSQHEGKTQPICSLVQAVPVYLNGTQPLVPNERVVLLSDCAVVTPTPMSYFSACFRLDRVRLNAMDLPGLNAGLSSCQGVTEHRPRPSQIWVVSSYRIRTLNTSLGVLLL